jgi:hypothetical protein
MSTAMQGYVAANLALAWSCRMVPTADPSVWVAFRGEQPTAAVWIDDRTTSLGVARDKAEAVLGRHEAGLITVVTPSASSAVWTNGQAVRTLAMPVQRQRQRPDLWFCETCGGRHTISRVKGTDSPMAACRRHENG